MKKTLPVATNGGFIASVELTAKFQRNQTDGKHYTFFTNQSEYEYSMGHMRVNHDGTAVLYCCSRDDIGFTLGFPRDNRHTFSNAADALTFYRNAYESNLVHYHTRRNALIEMARTSRYFAETVVTKDNYTGMVMKVEESGRYLGEYDNELFTNLHGCIEIECSIAEAMAFLLDERFCATVVSCTHVSLHDGKVGNFWSNWLFSFGTMYLKHGSSRDGSAFASCPVPSDHYAYGKDALAKY